MANWADLLVAVLGGGLVAGAAFFVLGRRLARREAAAAAAAATRAAAAERDGMIEEAKRQAQLAAREELVQTREAFEDEVSTRRGELERREVALDRRLTELEERATRLERGEQSVAARVRELDGRERQVAGQEEEVRERLATVAGLSQEEARREILRAAEDRARAEAAALQRDIKEQARREADREARRIVTLAIQRLAAEQTAESTVAAVPLPSDELKGRIIGREGRNIRAFEAATGVDVIIDDTPDTVVVSCFDPVRREVGRLALERLIADGRIHPGRIEEVVAKAREEIEAGLVEAGEQAAYETGIHGLHPELIRLVGRMKYRTSYGQNILQHSKEVAWLAGMMAAELKLDAHLAKRGGLLHDIGKVLTHEHDGTHVQLGVEVATRYGEHAVVVNCIAAHHDDVPHESPVSVIVQAADAVSGSRPGARREAFETYVKRLTQLEELASAFEGVERVYAIQAGREVRVVVSPTAVDDARAGELSEQIARKIEQDLQYPGQIRVVVIRETRAVGFAR
jgi:ribonuclease Y